MSIRLLEEPEYTSAADIRSSFESNPSVFCISSREVDISDNPAYTLLRAAGDSKDQLFALFHLINGVLSINKRATIIYTQRDAGMSDSSQWADWWQVYQH
jgi:hypothetical protein